MLVFYFSFFPVDDFLSILQKRKKPSVFITNIKSFHNFLHFHKDLRSRIFLTMKRQPFKKKKNLRFLAADFEKCKKEEILNSPNLSISQNLCEKYLKSL